jgi:transcriptional regulator with XRE-family HTH domain
MDWASAAASAMTQLKLKQVPLAKLVGCKQGPLSRILSGKLNPSTRLREKINFILVTRLATKMGIEIPANPETDDALQMVVLHVGLDSLAENLKAMSTQ